MTKDEHAETIRRAVAAAEADGMAVWIENDCCGCGFGALVVTDDRLPETEQRIPANQARVMGALKSDDQLTERNPFV